MTRFLLAVVTVGLLAAACGGGPSAEGEAETLSEAALAATVQTEVGSFATPIVDGAKTQTPNATVPPTASPAESPPEVTVVPLGDAVERGIAPVTPTNFKDSFLPLVRSAYQLVTGEVLSDRISIDVLDDFTFMDGSKYAETGTLTGPAYVQLGNDGAIHIFLRATTFVRGADAIGVELGHALQRERMGNESYKALRKTRLDVVSARAKAFQRAFLLGLERLGALPSGLKAPATSIWLRKLDLFMLQEVRYLAENEQFSISFFLVWQAALEDPNLGFATILRDRGALDFDAALRLSDKLMNADIAYFDSLLPGLSRRRAAEVRDLLVTRLDDSLRAYPAASLISGFMLP